LETSDTAGLETCGTVRVFCALLPGYNVGCHSVRRLPSLRYRRSPNRLDVKVRERVGLAEACGFGNPRYSRFGNLRYGYARDVPATVNGVPLCQSAGEVKIGAAHEIMAAWATKLAFLIDQLVTAAQTITPMLAGVVGSCEIANVVRCGRFRFAPGFGLDRAHGDFKNSPLTKLYNSQTKIGSHINDSQSTSKTSITLAVFVRA